MKVKIPGALNADSVVTPGRIDRDDNSASLKLLFTVTFW